VTNAVREKTGLKLREGDATRLAELLQTAGVTTTAAFADLIDPSGDRAASFANDFELARRRRPTMRELVDGLVGLLAEQHEREEDRAVLEAKLAESLPRIPWTNWIPTSTLSCRTKNSERLRIRIVRGTAARARIVLAPSHEDHIRRAASSIAR
jgi:hypothetical protein